MIFPTILHNFTDLVAEEDPLGMFKGAFAEQLIFQEMNATLLNGKIYYYSRDDSRGEIDFMIQGHLGKAIPIEAKSGKNLTTTTLKNFIDKWKIDKAIKFSKLPYKVNEKIVNAPLYLAGAVEKL